MERSNNTKQNILHYNRTMMIMMKLRSVSAVLIIPSVDYCGDQYADWPELFFWNVLYVLPPMDNSLSEEVLSQACRDEKYTECSGVAPVESGTATCQCRCHPPGT
jgi:hypothetical protein